MKKHSLIAMVVIIATTILATGCGNRQAATTDEGSSAVKVGVDIAKKEQIAETTVFTATLKGGKEMSIIPAVSDRIDRIYVEVGDEVKKGQLLVELNKLQLNQYNLQLINAKQTRQRMQPVFEAGGISQQQMDDLDFNIATLQEVVDNYKDNISFRSPVNGVVAARNFEEGDLFAMSAGYPLLKVVTIDVIKAYVGVSEQNFNLIYTGMPAEITTDVYPGVAFDGKVSRISPVINSMTRTFEVEIDIPNPDRKLRPGMFARATLNLGLIDGVTVNDLAIQRQSGSNERYVFVVKDGKAERRVVVTGRQNGNRIEIISGVLAGEKVVTAGMVRLTNGTEVEITD